LVGQDRRGQSTEIAERRELVAAVRRLPVDWFRQKLTRGSQTIWGDESLREAALEARRLERLVSHRSGSHFQTTPRALLDLPVSDRSE